MRLFEIDHRTIDANSPTLVIAEIGVNHDGSEDRSLELHSHARNVAPLARAREAANRALKRGYDQDVAEDMRGFFFLPFMHSEDPTDQDRCVELYRAADHADLKYAEEHRDIIRRFGRFPHRNAILGRATTPEEQAFLDGGGFKG